MLGPGLAIRSKTAGDAAACVTLMRETHLRDGYPRYWPARPERFLSPNQETDAWVAVHGGRVVGQVALHRLTEDDPVRVVAQQRTGLPDDRLVVLARLLVDGAVRGRGLGRALVGTAVARAHATDRRPVLDVLKDSTAVARLYESLGWVRIGETTISLAGLGYGDVPPLELWVYLAPPG